MAYIILRLPAVKARTGLSRSTIHLLVRAGTFPPPVRLGKRMVGWPEAEIDAWVSRQIRQSRKALRLARGKKTRPPKARTAPCR